MRLILALVLLVALSACSSGTDDSPKADPTKAATSARPDPTPQDPSGAGACAEVRAGIDAFNAGDFERTVKHFELALPIAQAEAKADASKAADDLVEAVRYYAELAPKDYPESARSSPEFVQYKTITLGQCVSGDEPLEGSTQSPGVTT